MVYKEYIVSVDSSTDIYTGNLSSFVCLLPTRFKNIKAIQLVDITLPSIANLYYEYLAIEGFNQICGPSGGMNFAFAKITLNGKGDETFVADTNTYNYDYIKLGNPIAALDRLQVSFVDARANLVTQTAPCNFQLRILKKDDSSIYGYGDDMDSDQNFTNTYKKVPRARRK